jgi:hypothetical protein
MAAVQQLPTTPQLDRSAMTLNANPLALGSRLVSARTLFSSPIRMFSEPRR